jgi:hypothetical protein
MEHGQNCYRPGILTENLTYERQELKEQGQKQ